MANPVEAFENALLSERVASRFAMEHDSPEALKRYLQEHPGADRSNHKVAPSGDGDSGEGAKGESKAKPKKGPDSGAADSAASRSKSRGKTTQKHYDDLKDLQKKVEDGSDSAKARFNGLYDKVLESGEAAAKAARGLIKKYDVLEDSGLSDHDRVEAEAAVKLVRHALNWWEENTTDHAKAKNKTTHEKAEQADQTNAYAQKLEKAIRQISRSLKGDHELEE